jgi:hypothetical protein
MAAEVDVSGVLLQQDPAAVELGAQNTVRASGDRGELYRPLERHGYVPAATDL